MNEILIKFDYMLKIHTKQNTKDLICKKEKTKRNNIIKQYKNFNFDYITKEDIKEHNPN